MEDEHFWIPIRNDIPAIVAATIMINPCTAYRMLLDFVTLKPGDWLVQNGSNSGVGQAVIQIAKTMGVKTVNIVRDRADVDLLKAKLTAMGGDLVLTEEELRATQVQSSSNIHMNPKLGLEVRGASSA